MADIRTLDHAEYNKKIAEALKNISEVKAPEWAKFVKTSSHKQRPSIEEDFWHKRAASILRQIYIRGVVGTGRLRVRYGGRKDNGVKPARFVKAGGKMIRSILQQVESVGFIEKVKGRRCGRQLTEKGRQFLESNIK